MGHAERAVKNPQGGNNDVYYSFLRTKIPFDPNPLIQVIVLTGLWEMEEEEPTTKKLEQLTERWKTVRGDCKW